jgi:hypothetical protein
MIHLQVVALYRASRHRDLATLHGTAWHGHLTTLYSASGHRDDAALDDTSGNWDNTGHFGIGGIGWVDGVVKDCLEEFEVCVCVCNDCGSMRDSILERDGSFILHIIWEQR